MVQRRRGLTVMGIKGTAAVVLMFALLISTVVAQQPQQRGTLEDPPWLKEFVHKRIVYTVPGMTRVEEVFSDSSREGDCQSTRTDLAPVLPRALSRVQRCSKQVHVCEFL